jgi:CheY-like chemotaxis protein
MATLAAHGPATVLLVDDEPIVREVTREFLLSDGYEVIDAATAEEALLLARGAAHVDVLLTDIVMPGLNGRQLAERLVPLRPEMSVLYMSGYANDVLAQNGALNTGIPLLTKPFTSQELTSLVRRRVEERRLLSDAAKPDQATHTRIPRGLVGSAAVVLAIAAGVGAAVATGVAYESYVRARYALVPPATASLPPSEQARALALRGLALPGVPVLAYEAIGSGGVSREEFARHLWALRLAGYEPIGPEAFSRYLTTGSIVGLPTKPVVIAFTDADEVTRIQAEPILRTTGVDVAFDSGFARAVEGDPGWRSALPGDDPAGLEALRVGAWSGAELLDRVVVAGYLAQLVLERGSPATARRVV